jgi:hypothetical protein
MTKLKKQFKSLKTLMIFIINKQRSMINHGNKYMKKLFKKILKYGKKDARN